MPRKPKPAPPPSLPVDLITTGQAAELLGLDPSQVRRHVRAKRLHGIAVTKRLTLVSRAEVERFTPPKPGPKSS